ncbi:lysophosphatidic acid receptor 1-like [Rhinatrema bivittatum]|uniref:lysophosphatidic acid receptor 1-like n=1 Tax=Rhinatrema bivittatum TaxID=194408 RepID=UPI00112AA930|nr:lysophosphatidic acid receptor 1-like [Rhinatrema bivittatum]
MNSTLNCSRTSENDSGIWNSHVVLALGIPQMTIGLMSIISNLIVVIAIVSSRAVHRSIFILFCNLAISDILVGSSGLWIAVLFIRDPQSTITGSSGLLKAYVFYVISILSTVYNLVGIAIERYLAVTDSLRMKCRVSRKQTLSGALINWALAIIFGCLPLTGWHCLDSFDNMSTLYSPFCIDYLIFVTIPNCILAIFLPLFTYIGIIVILRKQKSSMGTLEQLNTTYKIAEANVARTCIFIWILTMISYIPLFGGVLWDETNVVCPQSLNIDAFIFRNLSAMMITLNSLSNPIIYSLRVKSLGNNFIFFKCHSSNRIDVQIIEHV